MILRGYIPSMRNLGFKFTFIKKNLYFNSLVLDVTRGIVVVKGELTSPDLGFCSFIKRKL